MCWGVREVRGDVGKGDGREMWGSVLGPHTQTHFPTPLPTHPIHSPTLLHSPHTPTHFPTPPPTHLFPQLPSPPARLHPNTLPTHPMHLPPNPPVLSMWQSYTVPSNDVILINFTEKPDKISYHNREFKVLFRCGPCKLLMYESVVKLLATIMMSIPELGYLAIAIFLVRMSEK